MQHPFRMPCSRRACGMAHGSQIAEQHHRDDNPRHIVTGEGGASGFGKGNIRLSGFELRFLFCAAGCSTDALHRHYRRGIHPDSGIGGGEHRIGVDSNGTSSSNNPTTWNS